MKLYELSDAYRLVTKRLEEAEEAAADVMHTDDSAEGAASTVTGEDLVLRAALDSIKDAIEVKAEGIICLSKELEAEALALRKEEERLAKRRKALENRAGRLKTYLLGQLVEASLQKLRTKLFSISVRSPMQSVVVGNVDDLPTEFVRVKREPDKVSIKQALERGDSVPGAHLELGSPSMTVR